MAGLSHMDQKANTASMGTTRHDVSRASSAGQSLVMFRLDRQVYALPIDCVVQIVEMVTITHIPQLNSVVEGVINVHGESIAVFKLRRHFGLSDAPVELNTPILLVQIDGRTSGLIVDEVIDVLSISDHQVVHLPDIVPASLGDAPIFRGLTHVSGSAVLMLDPASLFLPQQLQALAQVTEILQQATEDEKEPAVDETEAAAKEAPGEPPAKAQPKPTRRRRRKAPSEEASPKEASEEPPNKAKPTRRRRKKSAPEETVVDAADEEEKAR